MKARLHIWAMLIVVLIGIGTAALPRRTDRRARGPFPWTCTRVIDGDTIVCVRDGIEERVRLLNIDTPERGQQGYAEAREVMRALVEGYPVRLEGKGTDGALTRDRYARLLAWVHVDGLHVNVHMVRLGHSPYVPSPATHPHVNAFVNAATDGQVCGNTL